MKTNPWNDMDRLMTEETISLKDGWFSTKSFTEKYKCPRATAQSKLENWLTFGILEKRAGVIADGKRGTYYRYVKKPL